MPRSSLEYDSEGSAGVDSSNDGESWNGFGSPSPPAIEGSGNAPEPESMRDTVAPLEGADHALIAQKILLLRQIYITYFRRTVKEFTENPPIGIKLPIFRYEFAESSLGIDDVIGMIV